MREIKFRGKPIEDYGDTKWFYGNGIVNYEDKLAYIEAPGQGFVPVEWGTVSQYTGLKDKDSKEIYEGDIVKYLDGNEWSTESGYDCEEFNNHGAIFFDEECGRYDVTNKQGIGYDDLFDCGVDFEIIGNIYENPELVKN